MTKKKAKQTKEKSTKQPILISLSIILVFLIIGCFFTLIYPRLYYHKIFPGVKVGKYNLAGKTFWQAQAIIEAPIDSFDEDGLVFIYQDKKVALQPTIIGTETDVSYDLLRFDSNLTIQNAYEVGRTKDWWINFKEQLAALFLGKQIQLEYSFNKEQVKKSLQENFSELETPHQNAQLVVNNDLSFSVKPEKAGEIFNYNQIVNQTENNVKNLIVEPISLGLVEDLPEITKIQAERILPKEKNILTYAPLTISYQNKSWEINKQTFATLLAFKIQVDNSTKQTSIGLGLDPEKVEKFFDSLRNEIEVPVKEGKFKISLEGGNIQVTQFQEGQAGLRIDLEESVNNMEAAFLQNKQKEAQLIIVTKQPEITTAKISELGIKEMIGEGRSNFAGSPTNRRKNISNGADKLNGILIKPEEEFSLLKALGKFEASEGWLPELVIKGNKTTPEIGGGACQFGTTMFRAALNTGLPITARTNHSYTVSYYFPIGTDATIYDPAPDLKFINDTGHYILLQTRIDVNDLIFEMWGTKDGRLAEQATPKLSNWQNPPDMKIIETEDLAPGQEKCTEREHKGVTAEFTYKITYPGGETKEQTFVSKYKPWQKVCLRGIEKKI